MREELADKLLVVDNFCDTPDLVVASVKEAGISTWLPNKGKVGSSVYEGMGFVGSHAPMVASIIKHLEVVIVPNAMFFRTTNMNTEQAYIHSDRTSGAYTCVCYLSHHEDEYGTAFYRHKPTGLLEMPSFQEMEDMGIFDIMKKDMVERGEDKWELVDFVQGKYNRAVLFNAPLFHSRIPTTGFGNNTEDGRLVWASHFYKLNGSGELY